eukprot:Gregarina_sp_Poly_1__3767@NODE_2117_length_2658_cov_83_227711_g1365_i0_p1_GENE_NODE_2117_length_2658_cov_83_227711_g1365_i0NODE_2117_length_2658_cov_83_227711_g1365_i0_p1_ORF_typecomplete_len246_score32_67_NODE_2117_length_2658_cov_83_227711_g1365_i011401877
MRRSVKTPSECKVQVYNTAEKVYAVVGNSYCIDWPKRSNIAGVREDATRFDRRISQSVKYVLPNGSRCLIASLGVTIVYDCVSQLQLLCPLRLPDVDVVPLDFSDNRMLAFIHNLEAPGPALKILKLPTSQEEPKWGVAVESIFHQDLPGVTGIARAKFWGDDRFVFVANGRHIYVFQISTGKELVSAAFALRTTYLLRSIIGSQGSMTSVHWKCCRPRASSLSVKTRLFTFGQFRKEALLSQRP